MHEIQNFFLHF
jgi:hypothetical protein